jgi:hypothetical protein
MPGGQFAHRFDLNVGTLHGVRAAATEQVRLDPNGKELGVEPAFFRADGVQMPILETRLEIDSLVDQTLGCIRVHINHNRAVVD